MKELLGFGLDAAIWPRRLNLSRTVWRSRGRRRAHVDGEFSGEGLGVSIHFCPPRPVMDNERGGPMCSQTRTVASSACWAFWIFATACSPPHDFADAAAVTAQDASNVDSTNIDAVESIEITDAKGDAGLTGACVGDASTAPAPCGQKTCARVRIATIGATRQASVCRATSRQQTATSSRFPAPYTALTAHVPARPMARIACQCRRTAATAAACPAWTTQSAA